MADPGVALLPSRQLDRDAELPRSRELGTARVAILAHPHALHAASILAAEQAGFDFGCAENPRGRQPGAGRRPIAALGMAAGLDVVLVLGLPLAPGSGNRLSLASMGAGSRRFLVWCFVAGAPSALCR